MAPYPDSMLPADHTERMARARLSLEGLSVGDGFGECFFGMNADGLLASRRLPAAPWCWTDDTAMALSIYEVLNEFGGIDCDALADCFARRHAQDPNRGYGSMARRILFSIERGEPWAVAAQNAFSGDGSMGNGGAMRVGPVGGYFADDLAAVVEHARRSAMVTHAHPDGQAGAIAVAVAAACAFRMRGDVHVDSGRILMDTVIEYTPEGPTRSGLVKARALDFGEDVVTAARALGNGGQVISSDTVPLAVWCAARHLDDFEQAMWTTVSAWGDIDTNCAIVGSIVAVAVGLEGIPQEWRVAREPLPLKGCM